MQLLLSRHCLAGGHYNHVYLHGSLPTRKDHLLHVERGEKQSYNLVNALY